MLELTRRTRHLQRALAESISYLTHTSHRRLPHPYAMYHSPGRRCVTPLQDKFDLLVIPGGAKGAQTMSESSSVQHLVREYLAAGKLVGMICAGMYTE